MKLFKFVIIISFLSISSSLISQPYINHMGDCESQNSRLHYDNFAFLSWDALDSLKYTHVFSFYCGSGLHDMEDFNLQKQFFSPFHFISYDTAYYALSSMLIHKIYSKRDSINASNEFLIELKIVGINAPLAFIYGSDNVTDNPYGFRVTLAYLVSMDGNDPYAAGYTPQELTYVAVYNQGGSYLHEIRDIDRQNMLVGLKYFSPTTQSEHIKFLVPNN